MKLQCAKDAMWRRPNVVIQIHTHTWLPFTTQAGNQQDYATTSLAWLPTLSALCSNLVKLRISPHLPPSTTRLLWPSYRSPCSFSPLISVSLPQHSDLPKATHVRAQLHQTSTHYPRRRIAGGPLSLFQHHSWLRSAPASCRVANSRSPVSPLAALADENITSERHRVPRGMYVRCLAELDRGGRV